MNKKAYSKPQINSEKLNAGVFGSYGGGNVSMATLSWTTSVINQWIFCCENDVRN